MGRREGRAGPRERPRTAVQCRWPARGSCRVPVEMAGGEGWGVVGLKGSSVQHEWPRPGPGAAKGP